MDAVIHVKVPTEWYEGLRILAGAIEGNVNQQTRLAIRERLERNGLLAATVPPGIKTKTGVRK